MIFETERLTVRELVQEDFADLCEILQDAQTMYAYEHAFSDEEAQQWLDRQRDRYKKDGFGLWALIRKDNGEFVGQAGLTMQQWEEIVVPEIGYLLKRKHWHKGYAIEAALGCKKYAFETLGLKKVYSIIRENNMPSRRVAEKNGMRPEAVMVKHYYGMDMPHIVYSVEKK